MRSSPTAVRGTCWRCCRSWPAEACSRSAMTRLRKFRRLPSQYRRLLVQAAVLLGVVRLGLRLVPFPTWRRLLARLIRAPGGAGAGQAAAIPQVVWAVTTASRYVPAATCLAQALAAQALLGRRGHP